MQHLQPTLAFKPLFLFPPTLYLLPLHPHDRLMLLAVSLYLLLPLPLPDSLRVLQWNAGGPQARSTELLHFISSHSVDFICIQECNLNSSFSFRIPGFSALRSDCSHSCSDIFSTDVTDVSGGVIIFVKQGLSFSELSTSSLSSLDPYSDYVEEVKISLNDSSSLSFLNVYALPIWSSPKDSKTNFFSPSILPSYVKAEAVLGLVIDNVAKYLKNRKKALELIRRQKKETNFSSFLTIVKRLYLYNYNKTPGFTNCARFQPKNQAKRCLKQRNGRYHC